MGQAKPLICAYGIVFKTASRHNFNLLHDELVASTFALLDKASVLISDNNVPVHRV